MEDDSYKGFSIKDAGVSRENLEAAFRALPHEMTAVAVDLAGTFLNTIDRLLVGRTLEAAYRADKAAASPADDEDLACTACSMRCFRRRTAFFFEAAKPDPRASDCGTAGKESGWRRLTCARRFL